MSDKLVAVNDKEVNDLLVKLDIAGDELSVLAANTIRHLLPYRDGMHDLKNEITPLILKLGLLGDEIKRWHNFFFGLGDTKGTPEQANEAHCLFIRKISEQAERATKAEKERDELLAYKAEREAEDKVLNES